MAKKTVAIKRRGKFVFKPATDIELNALAEITEADIEEAKAFARKYGTPLFNALLDADG